MPIQKRMQQINFTENFEDAGNATMFFFVEEVRETILEFLQKTVKLIVNAFHKFI